MPTRPKAITALLLFAFFLGCATSRSLETSVTGLKSADPHLFLEEIDSERALSWVRAHNDPTLKELGARPQYAKVEAEVREILLAKDRIPQPAIRGDWIYNFWQDERHVRGLWRRAPVKEYEQKGKEPKWDVLIDLDELGRGENESWVFHGANCLPPDYNRCLITLSRGGKDAAVVREFDIKSRAFVPIASGGFELPEAKSQISWLDHDTVLVGTDFGPGSLTLSGYPRQVRIWKRSTPLKDAKLLFEAKESDLSAHGYTIFRPEGNTTFVVRAPSFFEEESFLVGDDLILTRLPFPQDASFQGVFQGRLLVRLRTSWRTGGKTFPAGSLISAPLAQIKSANFADSIQIVYIPDDKSSIAAVHEAKNAVYLTTLENVSGRLLIAQPGKSSWHVKPLPFPDLGDLHVVSTDAFGDRFYVNFESFLAPASLSVYDFKAASAGKRPKVIKTLPSRFDTRPFIAEQLTATSRDGTEVPYFIIHDKNMPLDGANPTLLFGYGGFEVSLTPMYLGAIGKVWLERGGVYVLANIRGGGEFGPKWHQDAILANRQRAYDDFTGIAEDLIRRKITSPAKLGIQGGSNGGLLVGVAFTQRPELFNAVICEVPLLDMSRYHRLLAGNSWMGEYGDPDDPKMWEAISKYSPYQNLRTGRQYPPIFFLTSTRDDRVHPGHARKMAARMEQMGYPFYYYENIEGGHGAAADLEQRVRMKSLEFTYLLQHLQGK